MPFQTGDLLLNIGQQLLNRGNRRLDRNQAFFGLGQLDPHLAHALFGSSQFRLDSHPLAPFRGDSGVEVLDLLLDVAEPLLRRLCPPRNGSEKERSDQQ
jgi:hypothetical protein